jgi:hypothetical protein
MGQQFLVDLEWRLLSHYRTMAQRIPNVRMQRVLIRPSQNVLRGLLQWARVLSKSPRIQILANGAKAVNKQAVY